MNRFFWRSFKTLDESVCSKLQITHLTPQVQNYIRESVGTIEALLGSGSIKAVILFGSLSYGNAEVISDVDLLIVVKDHIHRKDYRAIEPILKAIEIKYKYSDYPQNWVMTIMRVIESTTGMFCSHFICKEHDWTSNNFARIFSTNYYITNMIAPDKIVLDSMKSGATLLYGNVSIKPSQKGYKSSQLVKSLIMDLLIGIGSLVILPFRKSNMKYVLEAMKWSFRSGYYFLFQKTIPLKKILNFYAKLGFNRHFSDRFQQLRKKPHFDVSFSLQVPLQIIRIHTLSLQHAKKTP